MKKAKTMKTNKRHTRKEKVLITIFAIVITLSILCVAGVFVLNSRFLINKDGNLGDNGQLDSDIVTPSDIKDQYVNFLVVGIDYLEGSSRAKLTDVNMVVSFDVDAKKVHVLQIPRDTYIGDDYPTGKINAIYGRSENGGIEGLARRVNKTFGISIDHYATINMDSFKVIVDKIGGVEVDVPTSFTLEGITIKKGLQVLDGLHAEKFVRERHSYANQDLGRIEMQQIFLKAMLKKLFSMEKTKVFTLAPTLISEVTTDLTLAQMLGYYSKLMNVDVNNDINFHTLSTVGAKNGTSAVLSIKKYEAADLLNQHFRPYTKKLTADELGILELVETFPNE